MADVFSAIILDTDYWDGTISWAGETSEANRDTKYSTRRYTSVQAWDNARDGLSQAGDDEFGIIMGPWVTADGGWTIATWGSDSQTLSCPILTTDGEVNLARHNGIFGNVTNAHMNQGSSGSGICNIQQANTTVDGLQMENTVTGDAANDVLRVSANFLVKNCIMSAADTGGNGFLLNTGGVNGTIENCVVFSSHTQGANSEGIYIDNAGTVLIYNCTVWNFNDGIERDAGTLTVKNCAVFNNVTDFDGTMTVDFCASDDGTGTNAVTFIGGSTAWDSNFTDYVNADVTPLDDQLPGAGVGPGSDANVPIIDIIGITRSGATTTIGAHEFVSGADALTSDDLTSGTPTIDTSGIGQIHAITATELNSGTPTIDTSIIGQIHGITADDLISGIPTIDLATLSSAGVENLISDEISSGIPAIDLSSIGQIHGIIANDLLSGIPVIDSSTIVQIQALIADDLTSGIPTIDQAILDGLIAQGRVTISGVAKSLGVTGQGKSLGIPGTAKSLGITGTGG